ncbi:MAG: diaminopropionate ammonia-lyase, partial [Planctomycetota bacterium]|nr:diaminopropionate ammonia-lyase [Planctomycetota bacterium]
MLDEGTIDIKTSQGEAYWNPHRHADGGISMIARPDDDVLDVHRVMPGYAPTPLVSLPGLAKRLGLGQIQVKDESKRFGLNAFKSLGTMYAVFRALKSEWEQRFDSIYEPIHMLEKGSQEKLKGMTLCAATAGNHGRALAWVAKQCGLPSRIFIPIGTAPFRIACIEGDGAIVTQVDGDYDDAVRHAEREAEVNGWHLIADFATPGYIDIPNWIESGYATIIHEITQLLDEENEKTPQLVVLQGGGGCFAAGIVKAIRHGWADQPYIVVVEPKETPSFLTSARTAKGDLSVALGSHETICSCLNCPTPSVSSWDTLRVSVDAFISIDDDSIMKAMRRFAKPQDDDEVIISGSAGAAGLAGLSMVAIQEEMKPLFRKLDLDPLIRVLLINTEG